jgi:hypothetical protein
MFASILKRTFRSTIQPWCNFENPLLLGNLSLSVNRCLQRDVHSATQVKRLFKKNATRRRIEQRMEIDRTPPPLDPPKYLPVYTDFTLLPNGWSAPPSEDFVRPQYPFSIRRTKNKPNDAIGFLPVYSKRRYVVNDINKFVHLRTL